MSQAVIIKISEIDAPTEYLYVAYNHLFNWTGLFASMQALNAQGTGESEPDVYEYFLFSRASQMRFDYFYDVIVPGEFDNQYVQFRIKEGGIFDPSIKVYIVKVSGNVAIKTAIDQIYTNNPYAAIISMRRLNIDYWMPDEDIDLYDVTISAEGPLELKKKLKEMIKEKRNPSGVLVRPVANNLCRADHT